jgi:hypothetical protein
VSDTLELEGKRDLEGADVAYFMNATDDPGSEGYSQLLPVAAAYANGAESVTIFPSGVYGPVNSSTVDEMEERFRNYPEIDEEKADFLNSYGEERDLGFDAQPVESLMDDEAYWEGLRTAASSVTLEQVRDTAPFGSSWFDNLEAAEALDNMPVNIPEPAKKAVSYYSGRELYTLLQASEYITAEGTGYDVVTGISSEESYQKFAEESLEGLDIDFARSSEPVDLKGEDDGKPPYVENDRDWVRLDDSPQEAAQKLDQADQTAVEQIQDIATQLDDDFMQEVFEK